MADNITIMALLNSRLILIVVSALFGIVSTIIVQRWLNRRALFTYSVSHSQVGLSAEDAIYGSVRITWNNNPVAHLYLSTVELINQSFKDFESVTVRAFTNNTMLLVGKTEVVGTTTVLEYTDDYKERIAVTAGEQPTESQFSLYRHEREYIISTMNREQTVRLEFLNAAESDEQPEIWLDVLHKGVKCKFRPEQDQFAGVSQSTAARVGILIGLILVALMLVYVGNPLIAAILSYLIGVFALLPGVFTIKGYQRIRNWFVG